MDSIVDKLRAFFSRPSGPTVPMSAGGFPMAFAEDPQRVEAMAPTPPRGETVLSAPIRKEAAPPPSPVPFYPHSRYVERNLAPEQTLFDDDIVALAQARRQAEDSGVLTKELAKYMLPMAMVEGRSGNYGIRRDSSFYASPQSVDRFKRMGLDIKEGRPDGEMLIAPDKRGDRMLSIGPNARMEPGLYSKLMAGILAEKAAAAKSLDPGVVVRRYNGKGKATERLDYGVEVPADVDVYWNKVQEADRMLQHPKNRSIAEMFAREYAR